MFVHNFQSRSLLLRLRCVDDVDRGARHSVICNGFTEEVTCPHGGVMNIISASYGRSRDARVCPYLGMFAVNCCDAFVEYFPYRVLNFAKFDVFLFTPNF